MASQLLLAELQVRSEVECRDGASVRTLGIMRRLVGCFYCGYPCPGDVCPHCSDLPLRDPLVSKARVPLSEQERIKAAG